MDRLDEGKDDEQFKDRRSKPFHYYEQQMIRRVHHFYLSKIIGEADEYVEMIHRIKMAGPEEMIFIHLNTPGGNLITGIQIVNALQSSQAHIICSVEATSHSLGTLIFLAADEFIVHDNCLMMFHNFSGGVFGKGHEQIAQITATTEWFNDLAGKLYIPFMSQEEFDRIVRGEDMWIGSEEIRTRLVHMVEVLEAKHKKEDKAKEAQPVGPISTRKRKTTKS